MSRHKARTRFQVHPRKGDAHQRLTPVRAVRFIARKNWFVCGDDAYTLHVYNYNNLEKVTTIAAHLDYIRSIAVHKSQPWVLSSSDDLNIKVWDWDKDWKCLQVPTPRVSHGD